VPTLSVHGTVSKSTGRLPLTGAEWVLVAVFAVASFALFGLNAVDAAANNRLYLGAAAATPKDSMQYLAWATDAGHHGLIANLYGFNNGGHVFFHPIWLVTGLLHVDAGVSYSLLLALWQAAALILLVIVLRRYAQLVLGNDGRARAVALMLALFLVSPFFLFVVNLQFKLDSARWMWLLTGESYAVQWISGYFPIALTVTAMIGYLIALERLMVTLDRPTLGAELLQPAGFAAAALGATAAFLHPWQGIELAVLTVGLAVWDQLLSRRNVRLLLPLAAIGVPLLYYLILPKIDAGWATSSRSGQHQAGIPLLGWLTTFGPAALASIPGWRTPATSDRQRLLRLWPLAVLVTFVAVPTGKFHAFAGLSVPLALLTVQGWRRVLEERRLGGRNPLVLRFLATAGAVVLVFGAAPATTRLLIRYRVGGQAVAQLDRPEADALDYLAGQPRGGVLSTANVGIWVPALTDDSTYVGHFIWSPRWDQRSNAVRRLFRYPGKRPLRPAAELALVEQPGARYVLEPCGARAKLWPLLKPHGYGRRVFGCATVYTAP
jgi:hypothetical protein